MIRIRFQRGSSTGQLNLPITWLLTAWPVMVLLGALHHDVAPGIPALSYWWTAVIMLVAQLVQYLHGVTPGDKR